MFIRVKPWSISLHNETQRLPMATTSALLSIDHYLRTSYHPDVDFVDGEIEERNVGENSGLPQPSIHRQPG